jgi:hypothetical protein
MRRLFACLKRAVAGILSPARLPFRHSGCGLTSRPYGQKRETSLRRDPAQMAGSGPFRPIFTRKYTDNRPSVFALAALSLAACGGGSSSSQSGCSGEPFTAAELELFEQTSACAAISAPAPRIQHEHAVPCPGAPDQLCLPGADVNGAGIRGHYRPPYTEEVEGCPGTLYIADPAVVAHEMVHHLLFHAGRPDYRDHVAAEFACGGDLS